MSSGCGDVLSLADLQTAKKHQLFEAEVITGKQGGVASGADIDYATNQVTGQTQKTLPAVLRDAGFFPASFDFTTGGTLGTTDRNKVVYDPVSMAWYSWSGVLPKVVAAGTNPLLDANWKPQTDPNLRNDLANTSDIAKGDALIGVKQPFTGAVGRTQHAKNSDSVSVKDFGAVADFNRTTNTGTDNTAAFQAAIDYCKTANKALFVPTGWYLVSGNLTATYAIVMYGEGANGVAVTTASQQDSPFIGSVIVGGNTTGYTLNVSPPNYQFGLSLRNLTFYGLPAQRSNVNHKALRLHNTGLQGYVENIAISGFGGTGLEIGYLQDTHFISLFIERCGTVDIAAIKFTARANYLYFQDCLMMACHYFVDNTDPVLFGRYVFWSGCHLEHGDYNGALGPEWDFYYNKTPMNLGLGSDWSFLNCIFVPVSNAALATFMGVSRLTVPYFMVCSGERFNMVSCRFNAPRDSVSSLALTGSNSRTCMVTDTIFQGADGGRPCIDAYYAELTNCTFNLDITAYTDRCYGVYVRRGGAVKACKFRLGATTGVRRTLGHLVLTDDDRYEAIYVSGNTYPDTTYVNGFVHRGCTISGEDGGAPRLVSISAPGTIDLSLHPTNVNFWVTAGINISDILNGQFGRRLDVIANTAGVTISSTGNVYPKGNVTYTMTAGVPVEFKGMLDISGNRKMFQFGG